MASQGLNRGPRTHKPGCTCHYCVARRRQEEAGPDPIRVSPVDDAYEARKESVVHADQPTITAAPHHSIRDRINQWLAIRALEPNLKDKEIAERLGIVPATLKSYIYKATKEGWLKFDNPVERLDNEIVPLVVDNLVHFLKEKDKTVTIETAKGALFPAYKEAMGIREAPNTILAIKIEAIPHDDQPIQLSGRIAGRARTIDSPESK
jgi:hypothetical protein